MAGPAYVTPYPAALEVVQTSADTSAFAGQAIVPKSGLSGYSVKLPIASTCPGQIVVCVREPNTPGSVCKVTTSGPDRFGDGSTSNDVDDAAAVYGNAQLRYAGIYLSDGQTTWWVLA